MLLLIIIFSNQKRFLLVLKTLLYVAGNTAALFGGVIWFFTFIPATLLQLDNNVPFAVQAISCFSINSAMSLGFTLILNRENTGGNYL